jgi:hypothetical protein
MNDHVSEPITVVLDPPQAGQFSVGVRLIKSASSIPGNIS